MTAAEAAEWRMNEAVRAATHWWELLFHLTARRPAVGRETGVTTALCVRVFERCAKPPSSPPHSAVPSPSHCLRHFNYFLPQDEVKETLLFLLRHCLPLHGAAVAVCPRRPRTDFVPILLTLHFHTSGFFSPFPPADRMQLSDVPLGSLQKHLSLACRPHEERQPWGWFLELFAAPLHWQWESLERCAECVRLVCCLTKHTTLLNPDLSDCILCLLGAGELTVQRLQAAALSDALRLTWTLLQQTLLDPTLICTGRVSSAICNWTI